MTLTSCSPTTVKAQSRSRQCHPDFLFGFCFCDDDNNDFAASLEKPWQPHDDGQTFTVKPVPTAPLSSERPKNAREAFIPPPVYTQTSAKRYAPGSPRDGHKLVDPCIVTNTGMDMNTATGTGGDTNDRTSTRGPPTMVYPRPTGIATQFPSAAAAAAAEIVIGCGGVDWNWNCWTVEECDTEWRVRSAWFAFAFAVSGPLARSGTVSLFPSPPQPQQLQLQPHPHPLFHLRAQRDVHQHDSSPANIPPHEHRFHYIHVLHVISIDVVNVLVDEYFIGIVPRARVAPGFRVVDDAPDMPSGGDGFKGFGFAGDAQADGGAGMRSPVDENGYKFFLNKFCFYTGRDASFLDIPHSHPHGQHTNNQHQHQHADMMRRSYSASSVEELMSPSPFPPSSPSPGPSPSHPSPSHHTTPSPGRPHSPSRSGSGSGMGSGTPTRASSFDSAAGVVTPRQRFGSFGCSEAESPRVGGEREREYEREGVSVPG
ncbi:hypothetical protein BD410DRAFT_833297 [Rickenella mellea]|uniref:Uncharacterized protein n=1 Tax=Rickenella mellea TaxID=50990 RepID=A0A4Y7PEU5_9AGAM|nr:hypothetical protein BD410DRAFT_833297 [Rickenella mellea]